MTAALDTTLELETPEHIAFRYQVAGPARRAAAYLVDWMVRIAIVLFATILSLFTSWSWNSTVAGFEAGALLVLFFVLEWGYFVFFEVVFAGVSPGKRAFRLRVIHQDGRNISFSDSVLRNLLRAADLLPLMYAVGLISMSLDRHFRRLGDLVAKTVVVHEPLSQALQKDRKVEETRIVGLPARLELSREERSALALFVRRFPSFSEARAEELADLLADTFRERYGVNHANSRELLFAIHERTGAR